MTVCLAMEYAPGEPLEAHSADDLLAALVQQSDRMGRYYGHPMLMASLFWGQGIPREVVTTWLDELVDRGDVEVRPDGPVGFSGGPRPVAYIQNRARFERFRSRQQIPADLRRRVMERDEHRCVECGATDDLSLDHIVPFSKGGPDTEENLRVLCRPCNSRKGAR